MSDKNKIVQASEKSADASIDIVAKNKETLLCFQKEVFNGHDWHVDTLAKYLTPDFVDHTAGPEAKPGLERVARRLELWYSSFSEAYKENYAVLGEGDMLAVLCYIHARHTGTYMGIEASNREVVIPAIEILRFKNDKISDFWSIYDYLSTASEIGAKIHLVPLEQSNVVAEESSQENYRGFGPSERKGIPINVINEGKSAELVAENKAALFRFQREVFNGHDWRVETLSKHLTSDFIDHAAGPGDMPGLEGVQSRFSAWQASFDDAEEVNLAMVGEGDMLAVLYDLHAQHAGDFMGIEATNKDVVIPGIEFLRFKDGKIAEHWGIYDFLTTAAELGAKLTFIPRPPSVQKGRRSVYANTNSLQ